MHVWIYVLFIRMDLLMKNISDPDPGIFVLKKGSIRIQNLSKIYTHRPYFQYNSKIKYWYLFHLFVPVEYESGFCLNLFRFYDSIPGPFFFSRVGYGSGRYQPGSTVRVAEHDDDNHVRFRWLPVRPTGLWSSRERISLPAPPSGHVGLPPARQVLPAAS